MGNQYREDRWKRDKEPQASESCTYWNGRTSRRAVGGLSGQSGLSRNALLLHQTCSGPRGRRLTTAAAVHSSPERLHNIRGHQLNFFYIQHNILSNKLQDSEFGIKYY